jgi:hypothetical protein
VVIPFAGVRASELSSAQRERLLDLIELYVANLREGHARVRMEEVRAHLDDTYFAWIGGRDDRSAYYYRIHSPVILIEFDHQRPVATTSLYGTAPSRQHIHTVVRTPNGNDYGKDLLRQHLERHPHASGEAGHLHPRSAGTPAPSPADGAARQPARGGSR